jgi:hypothetical protein
VADDLLGHRLHDRVVGLQQVVAAHARLARHTRGDDHDIRSGGLRPPLVGGSVADHPGVGPLDGAGFQHVERDASRLLIRDVDDDDVGQLLVGDRSRDGRPDVARSPDHRDFTIHRTTMSC